MLPIIYFFPWILELTVFKYTWKFHSTFSTYLCASNHSGCQLLCLLLYETRCMFLLVINPQRLSWMVKFIRWIFIIWQSYLSRYFCKYCILKKFVPFYMNHDFTMKKLTKLNKWNEMPLSLFCIKWRAEKLLFAVVTYYGYRGYILRGTNWNTSDSKLNHTRDFYQTLFIKCFVKIELANLGWIIH